MKSVCRIALLAVSCLRAQASVTLNIDALDLRSGPSGSSALVPTTGLFLLVASTTDGVFDGPTATSFSSGTDDVILFHGVSGSGSAGWFNQSINFPLSGNLNAGDPLRLYWFPTLTEAYYEGNPGPGAGTVYGYYWDSAKAPSDAQWVVPGDNSLVPLVFATQNNQLAIPSSTPNDAGWANFTVVPEASNLITAGLALGLCVFRLTRSTRQKAI